MACVGHPATTSPTRASSASPTSATRSLAWPSSPSANRRGAATTQHAYPWQRARSMLTRITAAPSAARRLEHDRQAADAEVAAATLEPGPLDRPGEPVAREAGEERLDGKAQLREREEPPGAGVDPRAEREVRVLLPVEVHALGIGEDGLVAVRARVHEQDGVPGLHPDAPHARRPGDRAPELVERGVEAQELVHRCRDPRAVLEEPRAVLRVLCEVGEDVAERERRRVVAGVGERPHQDRDRLVVHPPLVEGEYAADEVVAGVGLALGDDLEPVVDAALQLGAAAAQEG